MAEALKYRRVGIIGKVPLTETDASKFKDAVVAVVRQRKSNMPPEFQSMVLRNGLLIATVCDVESELWMLTYQEELAKASGLDIKIVLEKDIPCSRLYKGVFSHSATYTTLDILDTLEAYTRNFTLNTKSWTVSRRVDDGDTTLLYFTMDEASQKYIKTKKGVLPYRIGHALIDPLKTSHGVPTVMADSADPVTPGPSTAHGPIAAAAEQKDRVPADTADLTLLDPSKATELPQLDTNKPAVKGKPRKKGQPTIEESLRRSDRAKSENPKK